MASNPPVMTFANGPGVEVDTIFSDNFKFFEDLAELVEKEPAEKLQSYERFLLASIGIEKGRPFKPDADRKALFEEAAQTASAIARTKSFASTEEERLVYNDRKWE